MQKDFDVLCQGGLYAELLAWVDRYPNAGDGIFAKAANWTGGGMAANAAEAITHLGGKVALISITGDDAIGERSVEQLRKAGVNVEYVLRRKNHTSPIVLLMIDPLLRRAGLVLSMGSDAELEANEIPDELILSSKVFFTDMASNETSLKLAQRAKALGLIIAFDMQMTEVHTNLSGLNRSIMSFFEIVDYYFADSENFLTWTGENNIYSGCRKLLGQYPQKTLIITRGIEGSIIANSKDVIEIPAFNVSVIDNIGAGDAYHGAFLYSHLILGWDLRTAGLFASATAAISCTKSGARDGLPNMTQVLSFINEKKLEMNIN